MKDLKADEFSMAGSPDKFMQLYRAMKSEMEKVDRSNAAELMNLRYVLHRLTTINNSWIRQYEKRTGQWIR